MTAQKPHWITIALSIIAILLSVVSLYESCAVQKLSRATSRAMVIFGAAELTGFNVSQKVGERMRATSLTFNVQVQNVGKAMAHNVTLHYQAHLLPLRQAEISENGQILFGDDPPGTPVLGRATIQVPSSVVSAKAFDLRLMYKIAYDDEATGLHFDEREACIETNAMYGERFPLNPCFDLPSH